jgi:hypothetical protein
LRPHVFIRKSQGKEEEEEPALDSLTVDWVVAVDDKYADAAAWRECATPVEAEFRLRQCKFDVDCGKGGAAVLSIEPIAPTVFIEQSRPGEGDLFLFYSIRQK